MNCATLCPPLSRLLINDAGKLVCHCLLIETSGGLVLVDTGIGLLNCTQPGRLGRGFLSSVGPVLDPAEAAVNQVKALGFQPSDVRHVLLTHLDPDHAGGICDFPDATVHVYYKEHVAACRPWHLNERSRYQACHWEHAPRWARHSTSGERWLGFECVRDIPGLPPEILMVPLSGHTRGHSGVAVQLADTWLLHCGDAYMHAGEMDPRGRRCTPGLEFVQLFDDVDRLARMRNQERLRQLAREQIGQVRVFCSHDPTEFAQLKSQAEWQAA